MNERTHTVYEIIAPCGIRRFIYLTLQAGEDQQIESNPSKLENLKLYHYVQNK
ncbi:MAG: hypothetical protein ACJA1B_000584 [Polaribacter sp.]|jgi:hypothetical protein